MTRTQAVIIAILAGFVALVFLGFVVLIFFPYERLAPPAPTPIPPAPTVTPTPTFPNFMPTPAQETPVIEPTPTNTRLPTLTPTPFKTPTPTVVIKLPTRRPTDTPIPTPTDTLVPSPTFTRPVPTPVPRQYRISFEAEESTIEEGDCTDLKWEAVGVTVVKLDGQNVNPSGERKVCPDEDTQYELTYELPGSNQLQTKTVKIRVEEKED